MIACGSRWARRQGIETRSYAPVTGDRIDRYDAYETTPVAGILYQLNDELSVYANYIEGLTKGDTAPAESGGQQVLNSGTSLAPYVAKQTEIGLKYDGGNLGGSIAVFSTERPFGIVENQVFREGGEQRNRGIELSVFGEPAYGTRLLGGLTLLDAEQKKTLNGVNDGNDAIGVPKVQANIGGEWDVPGVQGLTLTSLVVHTGKQYASASNDLRLPSWTRLDLGARYRMTIDDRDVTFRARLDNATGRDYWPLPAAIRAPTTSSSAPRARCRSAPRSTSDAGSHASSLGLGPQVVQPGLHAVYPDAVPDRPAVDLLA